MSRFDVSRDGRMYDVVVRDTAQQLHERFPETDPRVTEANLVVARAWGSLQRLVEGIWAEHNLTGHQLSTLRLLLLAKGNRMTVKDITASLSIGSTNVTKLVNRLERAELVQRASDSDDRRVTWVELTDAGRLAYETVFPLMQRRYREVFAVLDGDEMELLVHLLSKLRMQALTRNSRAGAKHAAPAESSAADAEKPSRRRQRAQAAV